MTVDLRCWRGAKAGDFTSVWRLSPSFAPFLHLSCIPDIDTGASELIADGKIKLISGPQITRFTENAIVFNDGSEVQADVVVFATGCVPSSSCLTLTESWATLEGWGTPGSTSNEFVAMRFSRKASRSGASIRRERSMAHGVIWVSRVYGT